MAGVPVPACIIQSAPAGLGPSGIPERFAAAGKKEYWSFADSRILLQLSGGYTPVLLWAQVLVAGTEFCYYPGFVAYNKPLCEANVAAAYGAGPHSYFGV